MILREKENNIILMNVYMHTRHYVPNGNETFATVNKNIHNGDIR